MYRILIIGLIVFSMVAGVQAMCIEDQYGNQYDFVIDSTHQYVYGSVHMEQDCDAPIWYLTGSYVLKNGTQYEATAANPLGDSDTRCTATYKIKGTYPKGAWYYTNGYGGQEFTMGPCVSSPDNIFKSETGGALK